MLGCLMGDVDVKRVVLLSDEIVYLVSLIFGCQKSGSKEQSKMAAGRRTTHKVHRRIFPRFVADQPVLLAMPCFEDPFHRVLDLLP